MLLAVVDESGTVEPVGSSGFIGAVAASSAHTSNVRTTMFGYKRTKSCSNSTMFKCRCQVCNDTKFRNFIHQVDMHFDLSERPRAPHMSQLRVAESLCFLHFAQGWQNLFRLFGFLPLGSFFPSSHPPVQHLTPQNWLVLQSGCPVQDE